MAVAISEWRALAVDKVDENKFLEYTVTRNEVWSSLPVETLQLPIKDSSQVAVLSWRWDGEEERHGSLNAFCAVRQAKALGIKHLFIDIISIDQSLDSDALLERVKAFSTFYKTIPVIAAYDTRDEFFRSTMQRPWILSEVRAFRCNPTRIIYAGHNGQGANFGFGTRSRLLEEKSDYWFGDMLLRIWSGGCTHTILGVLCDQVGMHTISDFKFVIPSLANILAPAFEKMSRNDYLLTAALLCQCYHIDRETNTATEAHPHIISELPFDRYKFTDIPSESYKDEDKEISLDGNKIAVWRHAYNDHIEIHRTVLLPGPNAEQLIFTALGLSEADYASYVANRERRRASLVPETHKLVPKVEILPDLEIPRLEDL